MPLGERTLVSPRASCSQLGRQEKRVIFLSAKACSQSKEARQPGHADRFPRHCRGLDRERAWVDVQTCCFTVILISGHPSSSKPSNTAGSM